MNSSMLPYWLSLLVLLGGSYGGWKWYQVQQYQQARAEASAGGIRFEGPPLEEFELTERSGEPFRSADMKGRVWVSTFFFASCAGQCPRLNANVKRLHDLPELKDVTWVSITVDPDNDTLEVLSDYADRYQADPERWLFCRGDFDYVKRVGEDIMKMEVSWRGHKDYAIVIDRAGKVRGMFDATSISQSEKLRLLLMDCLAEETPAHENAVAEPTASATQKDG